MTKLELARKGVVRARDWFIVCDKVVCAMHKLESKITEIELADPKLTSVYF